MLGSGHEDGPSELVPTCWTSLASPVAANARKAANVLGGKLALGAVADDAAVRGAEVVEAGRGVGLAVAVADDAAVPGAEVVEARRGVGLAVVVAAGTDIG